MWDSGIMLQRATAKAFAKDVLLIRNESAEIEYDSPLTGAFRPDTSTSSY